MRGVAWCEVKERVGRGWGEGGERVKSGWREGKKRVGCEKRLHINNSMCHQHGLAEREKIHGGYTEGGCLLPVILAHIMTTLTPVFGLLSCFEQHHPERDEEVLSSEILLIYSPIPLSSPDHMCHVTYFCR